jgi:hypothetical protein
MIKPSDLTDAIVEFLQGVPELIAAMGYDENNIYAYDDTYPIESNFQKALESLGSPGILIRYLGVRETEAGGILSHSLSLYARPASGDKYSDLTYLILTGIDASQEQSFLNRSFTSNVCLPRIEGDFAPVVDENGVEYLELNLRIDEQ